MVHCKRINADQMEEDHGLAHQFVVNVSFHVIPILIRPFVGVRFTFEIGDNLSVQLEFVFWGVSGSHLWEKVLFRKSFLDGGETIPSWEFEMINDEIDSMDHLSLFNQNLDWWEGALHDQQQSNLLSSQINPLPKAPLDQNTKWSKPNPHL